MAPKVSQDTKDLRCGLSPVAFWALAVALNVLALGAIGGGIAAAVLRRESTSENNATLPTPDPTDEGTPSQSQLSAVNWADSSNQTHKAVFYQKSGNLWLSQNSEGSADWTALDIGSRFSPPAAGGETVVLNPKNRTPLASVVVPAGAGGGSPVIYLYYLDAGNTVRDIRTTATAKGAPASPWVPGELWGKNSTLFATANTGLAALAHYCPEGCMNQNVVVFQKQGNVLSADGRDWSNISHIVAAVAGTPLSLFPSPVLTPDLDKYDYSRKPQARLFYQRDGPVHEAIFNDKSQYSWTGGALRVINNNSHKQTRLATAVTTNNARGLILALDVDSGNVTASYLPRTGWDAKEIHKGLATWFSGDGDGGSAYTTPTQNRPSGDALAAIALTPDSSLYTLSRDRLHIREYAWSDSDTNKFDFIGTVL
ncbi:hypothetical protein PG991_014199 [Apiospora marii]|uniref:Fucose-specific lectin n=1 Tax=Apiospora marii TaxID=335849 RepID=A0ABR1R866_9PEZI